MIKLLLGLAAVPSPHDAADALAVAICHIHTAGTFARIPAVGADARRDSSPTSHLRSWRQYRP
jgi:crossover junction endodeoxyribonuclease RuvC